MTKREVAVAGAALVVVVVALVSVLLPPRGESSSAAGTTPEEMEVAGGPGPVVLPESTGSSSAADSSVKPADATRREARPTASALEVFVTDPAGKPRAEAHVSLLGALGRTTPVVTDAKGRARLENLPVKGRIVVHRAGHDTVKREFDLTQSESITVVLGQVFRLDVLVVDPFGNPAPDVRLKLLLADMATLTQTEKQAASLLGSLGWRSSRSASLGRGIRTSRADGTVHFRGNSSWEGRTLRLEVYGPTPSEGTVEIPWDTGDYTLRLPRKPWSIQGRVSDGDDRALEANLSWDGPSLADQPSVDTDGTFLISGLLIDEVVLNFDLFLFVPKRVVVRAPDEAATAPVELDVILERGRVVELVLGSGVVGDLDVWLLTDEGEPWRVPAHPQESRSYALIGLPRTHVDLRIEVGGGAFELACPAATRRLELALPVPGSLVVRAPNPWAAGQTVRVEREGGRGQVLSAELYHRELGLEARFRSVLPGVYRVTHEDEAVQPLRVEVLPGSPAEASFEVWMRDDSR